MPIVSSYVQAPQGKPFPKVSHLASRQNNFQEPPLPPPPPTHTHTSKHNNYKFKF